MSKLVKLSMEERQIIQEFWEIIRNKEIYKVTAQKRIDNTIIYQIDFKTRDIVVKNVDRKKPLNMSILS